MPRRFFALVLVVLAAGGCRDSGPTAYGDETRAVFMRSCARPEEGGLPDDVCRCAYSQIVATIPFEEFEALDEQLADDPPEDAAGVPDEIVDIYAACAVAGGITSTTQGN